MFVTKEVQLMEEMGRPITWVNVVSYSQFPLMSVFLIKGFNCKPLTQLGKM